MSSRAASPASRSVMPGSEEARRMTATSGRKCSALLKKSGLLGLLVKMLLASPRWSSRARFLKWQAIPLYSERVTLTRRGAGCSPSSVSAQTLRVSDIPSSRCLFRLVPWARPTNATGCSSSGGGMMLPTPRTCSSMAASLETEAMTDERRNPNLEVIIARRMKEGLLPTQRSNKVNGLDLNSEEMAQRNRGNLEEAVAKMVVSQVSEDGTPSRLSPLFTEEMMGFPSMWLVFPFLSENGAQKP